MEVVVGDILVEIDRGEIVRTAYVDRVIGEWRRIEDYWSHGDVVYVPTPLYQGCNFLKVNVRTGAVQCIEEPEEV